MRTVWITLWLLLAAGVAGAQSNDDGLPGAPQVGPLQEQDALGRSEADRLVDVGEGALDVWRAERHVELGAYGQQGRHVLRRAGRQRLGVLRR